MASIEPILKKSLKSGLITKSAIADGDYPEDACLESVNFHFDTIGNATLRKGITEFSTILNVGFGFTGMYDFQSNTAGRSWLLAAVGGSGGSTPKIAYYNSATDAWVGKENLTKEEEVDFTTFLNYVFKVNPSDATKIWDGDTSGGFVNTGNALNAPTGKFIENFRSRVWIAGNTTYPDRVYYSSVPSAVATPIITWNTSATTGEWIDISPSDGENITALKRTKNALLVFKDNHIYQIASVDSADVDPKINVGTLSKKSLVETKVGLFFHHRTGFYQYANGTVQEVSQPVIDIINNITLANASKVTGWLEPDGNHICWAVGDVTVDGYTYTNTVLRYTISSGVWTQYSYPIQFIVSSPYDNGSSIRIVTGDEDGRAYFMDYGNTDDGTPIYYSLIHGVDSVDGFESTTKRIEKMLFLHNGGQGTNVNYRTNKDEREDYSKHICQLKKYDTGVNNANLVGTKFSIKISGTSTGEPFIYEGYEVLTGERELITFT